MKIIKTIFLLLFCMHTVAFAAEMDTQQFFDLENSQNTTRIEILEKTTGNRVNITKDEEVKKAYEILSKMDYDIMTYDAYVRENNIGTSNYTVMFYQKDTVVKQIEITQQKIYDNKWVFFPKKTPNDFYYFAKYMILTKQNYKKSFLEEDFYKNIILWKDNIIIFNEAPYYNEQYGVMAELKTLNTIFAVDANYHMDSQTVTINGINSPLYGEQKENVLYVAVEPFVKLLSYETLWDDTLKILTIQQPQNDNQRWEKLRGIPKVYGDINTIFENISLETFLNIQKQIPFTKITIKNEKTNYTTTITDEDILQQIYDILNHTTVYQIEKQYKQADEPIHRYAVTLYQNEKPIKTFFMTSENVIKDEIYRVSMSTAFFDCIHKISEITYSKAILNQWKVM